MSDKNTAVFGIYKTRGAIENAIDTLKSSGFQSSDVSALLPDTSDTRKFAIEKQTKVPEGAVVGVGSGAVLGGALGWLVGMGAIAIPVVGPFIAAGPIFAALAGIGIGGAVGGVTGALIGMGIPEFEAKKYVGYIKDGGSLLSVHSSDRAQVAKAKKILEETGAQDITTTGELSSSRAA